MPAMLDENTAPRREGHRCMDAKPKGAVICSRHEDFFQILPRSFWPLRKFGPAHVVHLCDPPGL